MKWSSATRLFCPEKFHARKFGNALPVNQNCQRFRNARAYHPKIAPDPAFAPTTCPRHNLLSPLPPSCADRPTHRHLLLRATSLRCRAVDLPPRESDRPQRSAVPVPSLFRTEEAKRGRERAARRRRRCWRSRRRRRKKRPRKAVGSAARGRPRWQPCPPLPPCSGDWKLAIGAVDIPSRGPASSTVVSSLLCREYSPRLHPELLV
ncbi:hypothetical protein EJB05_49270 [Eragrostis curvula]|uniref:Uncharacterized protein n=1 Tax=Eragrostis curvula TaxID=38414 RepID=A0A5J9T519_9POAL|nr:hypothetical protein EJB05_49270 [Eragrostis curvula]